MFDIIVTFIRMNNPERALDIGCSAVERKKRKEENAENRGLQLEIK